MFSSLGVIRSERTKLNLFQEEFSYSSKLDRSYTADVERGIRNIPLESVRKLSAISEPALVDLPRKIKKSQNKEFEFILQNSGNILFVGDDRQDAEVTLNALDKK